MKNSLLNLKCFDAINGQLIDNIHYYTVRIFYEDTDAGGIIYHANYLKYFERARTSLLNYLKIDQKKLLDKKHLAFVVRDINLKINKSFKFNQLLVVKTCLKSAKKSCIVLSHKAFNFYDNKIMDTPNVKCEIQIVMIDKQNKVRDISKILVDPFFKIT